jgi:hypothetical protein
LLGIAAATGISYALQKVGNDFAQRYLSPREQKRVGATIIIARTKVNDLIQNGLPLREDDFFEDKPDNRSAATEIVEGVLLAAQREPEEKKIQYYSTMLALIAFYPVISRAHANQLINLAQRLTYRQYCLLSLFTQREKFNLRNTNYQQENTVSVAVVALLSEIFELEQLGLINSGEAVLGMTDITPGKMKVEGQGKMLYNLMQLNTINPKELEEISQLLR